MICVHKLMVRVSCCFFQVAVLYIFMSIISDAIESNELLMSAIAFISSQAFFLSNDNYSTENCLKDFLLVIILYLLYYSKDMSYREKGSIVTKLLS